MDRSELAQLLGITPQVSEESSATQLIEESDPAKFIAAFSYALRGTGPIFLVDPHLGQNERKILADLIVSQEAVVRDHSRGWLMIASGGTSGKLKFARHDEQTLAAAVRGFCKHFYVKKVNWVGVLPLYHVSGFVAWCRTVLTGGTYIPWDWKHIEAGKFPAFKRGDSFGDEGWYISLVPTQLQRILNSQFVHELTQWLRSFDGIFIGGGPIWPSLADQAARLNLPLCLSYGMTETAAMVTALRPKEFLDGRRDSGSALPHACVSVNRDGLIEIDAPSISLGYYPDIKWDQRFITEDLGVFDEHNNLTILGRRDSVIITGGKKVDPSEVEAVLRASNQFDDIAVVGILDPEWGQSVVALYPNKNTGLNQVLLDKQVETLASFKRPKRYIGIDQWPRNLQGKLNRLELIRLIPKV
jgi:o-succinylbenzoate---CoA ligase